MYFKYTLKEAHKTCMEMKMKMVEVDITHVTHEMYCTLIGLI